LGKDYFTPEQFETLEIVINNLLMEYPQAEVLGHRDLDPHKTCPNFNVKEWWNDRRTQL
jgi:N-acetyl-anhydromuramyl-L-alanine amidase AmpD